MRLTSQARPHPSPSQVDFYLSKVQALFSQELPQNQPASVSQTPPAGFSIPIPERPIPAPKVSTKTATPALTKAQARAKQERAESARKMKNKLEGRAPERTQPTPLMLTELLDRQAVWAKRGKGAKTQGMSAYAYVLHLLACETYQAKGYACLPSQVTLFLSNEMLAAMFGVAVSTIYRWNLALKAIGYLDCKPHKGSSQEVRKQAAERRLKAQQKQLEEEGHLGAAQAPQEATEEPQAIKGKKPRSKSKDTVTDGTVYAIRFRPDHRAKLSYEDMNYQYRNLDADREAGRTAHKLIQEMKRREQEGAFAQRQRQSPGAEAKTWIMHGSLNPREMEWYLILRSWCVGVVYIIKSLEDDPCILEQAEPRYVDNVVQGIGDLPYVDSNLLSTHISNTAYSLTKIFGDPEYHRAYCKLLWDVVRQECEMQRSIQALQTRLYAIFANMRENPNLKRPGALLMRSTRAA